MNFAGLEIDNVPNTSADQQRAREAQMEAEGAFTKNAIPTAPPAEVKVDAKRIVEENHPTFDGVEVLAQRVKAERAAAAKAGWETRRRNAEANDLATRKNPKKLIATTTANDLTGATVWWQLSGSVLCTDLVAAFRNEGLSPDILASAEASSEVILRRIAKELGGVGKIVKQHPKGGWSIVSAERVDESERVWDSRKGIRIWLEQSPLRVCVEAPNGSGDLRERVEKMFVTARESFSAKDISKWLTEYVGTLLRGVSLRWNGGMYFIPRESVETYGKIERALASCTEHQLYEMPTLASDKSLRAILDAVRREAFDEVSAVEAELNADGGTEMGAKKLANRIAVLTATLEKVESYEKLLGQKLGDATDHIRKVLERLASTGVNTALLEVD